MHWGKIRRNYCICKNVLQLIRSCKIYSSNDLFLIFVFMYCFIANNIYLTYQYFLVLIINTYIADQKFAAIQHLYTLVLYCILNTTFGQILVFTLCSILFYFIFVFFFQYNKFWDFRLFGIVLLFVLYACPRSRYCTRKLLFGVALFDFFGCLF